MIKAAMALLMALSLSLSLNAQQSSVPKELPQCIDPIDPPLPDNMIRPKYPKLALNKGTGATVEIRAVIAPDGKTKELVPLQSDSDFSKSALDAVRRWRFHPISEKGRSVETTYKVQIRFNPLLREANGDLEVESPKPEQPNLSSLFKTPPNLSLGEPVHTLSESGMTPPKSIYEPKPEFAGASLKKKDHGNVGILLVVGSDGLPRDLNVICSSVQDSDENAIAAVKQWKFSPATKNGKPVAVAVEVEVSFKLH